MNELIYVYDWYSLGCDCCTDSTSEIEVYKDGKEVNVIRHAPPIENAQELRKFIAEVYPEYSEYVIIDDHCCWF